MNISPTLERSTPVARAKGRTAVIYSGEARSFAQVIDNQYFHFLRKLENPEFFVCVADDAQADDMAILVDKFPSSPVHIFRYDQPKIAELPDDPPFLCCYPPSVPQQNILRQFWFLQEAWKLFLIYKTTTYDCIVRIRPDIAFCRYGNFEFIPGWPRTCVSPWFARWGGINDRLALMDFRAAEAYFTTFNRITELRARGCPLHPEMMLAASLEMVGIHSLSILPTEFVTVRTDGTYRPVDFTQIDLAEYFRT